MTVKKIVNGKMCQALVWTDDIDSKVIDQIKETASLPIVGSHIAIMPDVHWGMGATIGSVVPTIKAIVPACVGVDIGCGMMAVKTSLTANDMPDSMKDIRSKIERSIPVGRANYQSHKDLDSNWRGLKDIRPRFDLIMAKNPGANNNQDADRYTKQLGTLGGGNHFIEICLDEDDNVWVMLHSGSRNVGNTIARYFINEAKEDMSRQGIKVPNKDLSYLTEGTQAFADYIEGVKWAQDYAFANRQVMMTRITDILSEEFGAVTLSDTAVNCHHNYISIENHFGQEVYLTRKGAIRAGVGDMGIIPGSMGAKSFIVKGKGNADSFSSCSHGAGRILSRSAAKAKFTIDDVKAQTEGVCCRKDASIIDEIPGAYKDIDVVMANQSDLVSIVHTLKQIVCVKG